jgi:hypothetical protein
MLDVSVSKTAFLIAASQGGTPVWVTPVIAAGAAIAAALATALSSAYVARRKVAELQLTNSFELAKQYLESARNYTQSVYLPLAIEVYSLQDAFLAYEVTGQTSERSAPGKPPSPRDRFENDCQLFIGAVNTLFRQGAGAVLTVELDDDVTSFLSFLRESMNAERTVKTRSSLETFARGVITSVALVTPIIGVAAALPTKQLLEFGTGSGARYEIAAAPITSHEFEKQFTFYISAISSGIKQVTLGGYK